MIKENLVKILGEENVFENEIMKKHTSFKTGGIADFFVIVNSENELKKLLKYIKRQNIPSFIIGNGTNLLVTDSGFRGIIIKLNLKEILLERYIDKDYAIMKIGAGFPLTGLKKIAIEKGLDNLEFLTGIPGTIGGAVKMNAGAYGSEIKDILVETKVMDRKGKIFTLKNKNQK